LNWYVIQVKLVVYNYRLMAQYYIFLSHFIRLLSEINICFSILYSLIILLQYFQETFLLTPLNL